MVKKYIRRCKNCFPVYGKEERQFLKRLRRQIEEYAQENPDVTYKQIEERFGTPIDIVKSYYDSLEDEDRLIAVSYTHLDVYKRQSIPSAAYIHPVCQ